MIDMSKTYGAASEQELSDFEQRFGVALPNEYRDLRPNLAEFIVPGWGESIANSFYGIRIGGVHDIERAMGSFKAVIPSDLIPIGNDPGGNKICVGVRGEHLGKIYFWDHSDWDDDGEHGRPIEIFSTLGAFFDACKI